MRLKQTHCTNCGGMLDLQVADSCTQIFCPYCGQKYEVDQHRKEIVVTKTVNINNRFTNDAEVIRARTKDRSSRLKWILILGVVVVILVAAVSGKVDKNNYISAGDYSDYSNMSYQDAEECLRRLGFQNISIIDLGNVHGWHRDDDVESVVIDGKERFHDFDTFDPSSQVMIKHY